MIGNASVPVDTLLPHIAYRDVAAAVEWLSQVFGFREHYRYGDPAAPSGVQMRFGSVYFMLMQTREGRLTPAELGYATQMLTVFVEDVDGQYERVRGAGGPLFEELHETVYGERQFGALDLDGHRWLFSRHARDVRPEEWGAVVAEPST